MEQSQAARLQSGQLVRVTLWGAVDFHFSADIVEACGRRVALRAPVRVTAGQALRIESGDDAFLGEVVCCKSRFGTHIAIVELDQVLTGLAALDRMLQQFADEPLRPETVHAVQNRHYQDRQQAD